MSKAPPVSQALQQFLTAPQGKVDTSAYYRHPMWRPGVRALGSLSFAGKALLISLMFLIPLTWVSWEFYSAQSEDIVFSEKELLGVQYTRQVFPVIAAAQQLRRDAAAAAVSGSPPATMPEVLASLQAAQSKLAEVEKRLGPDLNTAKAYANVKAALADAEKATDLAAVFTEHTKHVVALIALLQNATDNSNLTLDPAIDSFYLMDAALFRIPDIVEGSGIVRGMGRAVILAGSTTPAQQQVLSDAIPVAEFQLRNLTDSMAKAYAFNPALRKSTDSKEALEDSAAFFALARSTVFSGKSTDAAQFVAAGNKAVSQQFALSYRALTALEDVITQRVKAMRTKALVGTLVLVIGILLAAYFFYSFYLVSNGSIVLISRHLAEVSDGDLRHFPNQPLGSDEPAKALLDLRQAYDALHALIRKVRHSARALHAASSEISAGSLELSARTEAAAASLEEQAAAMEEIGSTVGATAERAHMASEFATENAHVAQKGGKVFDEVVLTMREIHSSSSKINDIIGVIDGIAFQTNILALNAAVEAARAGESGRGFAVVASEVRSLAGRSADAAREIKILIAASVDKVKSGTRVVEEAGLTMKEVVTNASQINQFLTEISIACREQAVGVEEVGRAIQELDKGTQQNSALVEETAAAASALTCQADILQDEIANFRVSHG
ncbi:MAG: methyl-accepting chemotaxis protein [Rhodoferax sp.]|nr:methyl-accepting chemotaxis protein [Rhodoferax sp.]